MISSRTPATTRAAAAVAAPRVEQDGRRTIPMNDLPQPPTPIAVRLRNFFALATLTLLAGCANSDFGEINSTLVIDGIHDWIGRDSRSSRPIPPSTFEYTDDERALRDNAYPLIEPPYDRQRWYSVAGEYGLIRATPADHRKYFERVMDECHRSPTAVYARLIDDIRNDTTRLSQFFETAGRVIDIDQKRQKSLAYVSELNKKERVNALRRIRENVHVVDIVRQSLSDRVAAYHFALERLVITTPSAQAIDVERVLNQLQYQIVRYRDLPPTWVREPSLVSTN
jgi:hypothetical protein